MDQLAVVNYALGKMGDAEKQMAFEGTLTAVFWVKH